MHMRRLLLTYSISLLTCERCGPQKKKSPQNTRASSPSEATEHEGLAGKKEKEKKKKKKSEDERDALGRRPLLTDCEVRGEPVIGEKLTAFAKVPQSACVRVHVRVCVCVRACVHVCVCVRQHVRVSALSLHAPVLMLSFPPPLFFFVRQQRAKKVSIGCTFQWYRVDLGSGEEVKVLGQDRASYLVTELDSGYALKVIFLFLREPISAAAS
jgi:hypothetical protein